MKILVADDDLVSRTLAVTLLEKMGYEVMSCENGKAALDILQGEDSPPIAILDWMMPDMDGPDVIRALRKNVDKYPYLILLTHRTEITDKVEGLDAGADDYLVKPIDPLELRARLRVGERILNMQESLDARVQQLSRALEEIKTLKGILPICSYCKKIRDDKGYWEQVEVYVRRHSGANFSHSICPGCMQKHFPDIKMEG